MTSTRSRSFRVSDHPAALAFVTSGAFIGAVALIQSEADTHAELESMQRGLVSMAGDLKTAQAEVLRLKVGLRDLRDDTNTKLRSVNDVVNEMQSFLVEEAATTVVASVETDAIIQRIWKKLGRVAVDLENHIDRTPRFKTVAVGPDVSIVKQLNRDCHFLESTILGAFVAHDTTAVTTPKTNGGVNVFVLEPGDVLLVFEGPDGMSTRRVAESKVPKSKTDIQRDFDVLYIAGLSSDAAPGVPSSAGEDKWVDLNIRVLAFMAKQEAEASSEFADFNPGTTRPQSGGFDLRTLRLQIP